MEFETRALIELCFSSGPITRARYVERISAMYENIFLLIFPLKKIYFYHHWIVNIYVNSYFYGYS